MSILKTLRPMFTVVLALVSWDRPVVDGEIHILLRQAIWRR